MNNILTHKTKRRVCCLLFALLMCVPIASGLQARADVYQPPEALAALWKLNNDVVAGIVIPGTGVCYPILQHPTLDDYYLNVCFDGTEGYPGSIDINSVEGKGFDTFNTVIYGHNMRDGSYFGSLRSFRDPAFLAEHREIDIYTAFGLRVYDIFAVVTYGDRRITDIFDDEDPADRAAFLETLKQGAEDDILLMDVPVSTEGHIITLSTCISEQHDSRLLVVAAERTGY